MAVCECALFHMAVCECVLRWRKDRVDTESLNVITYMIFTCHVAGGGNAECLEDSDVVRLVAGKSQLCTHCGQCCQLGHRRLQRRKERRRTGDVPPC